MAVVLADAVGVEADLVGAFDLFEQVLDALDRADVDAADGSVTVETKLSMPIRIAISSAG